MYCLQFVSIEVKDVNLRFVAFLFLLGGYSQQSRKAMHLSDLSVIPLPHSSKRLNRLIMESDYHAKR
jgi:hypothetical protein